jgi:hypothetical protein
MLGRAVKGGPLTMSSAHDQQSARPDAGRAGQAGQVGQPSQAGQYVPRPTPGYDTPAQAASYRPSGAVIGWTAFAAVLMMVSGLWSFLEGLAAIVRGSFFVQLPNYAYEVSIRGWGWIHLALGIVVFLAGLCVFTDRLWARMVGVTLAVFSLIANFMYIPYQPVWSIVVIAIDVFVIWALMQPRRAAA